MSSERRTPNVIPELPQDSARAESGLARAESPRELARGTDPALTSVEKKPDTNPFAKARAGTNPFARVEMGPGETGPFQRVDAPDLKDLEERLARCMATLTMHFQPIVHAATRKRFGYEALMRTTDKALPHPGAILDAAERLEKIPTVGRAVRAQTAKVFSEAPVERGVVFINLHLLDLLDKQLTSAFAPLTKISSRVVLEITERTSLQGQADVRYRVAELRELGFKIAIDDLGGGHARMGTFSPFDTDFVKLDMSLVRDIDRQPMKQRLVKSVTELCREHGTQVIGEGVETEAEAQTLVELGCDLLQGYLIAKPAPPFADPL
ncbi:MAG: EAL domain-containing protein [Kofleriaceae bacterium]|nr:EAL domain-containing protein [Kofleriaceae bacterium]